jgi:hypothetical protein
MSTRTHIILTTIVILFAIALPSIANYIKDQQSSDTDAQRAAKRQAAEDQCIAMYGSTAMFFETKGGHLVCRDSRA